MSLAGWLRRLFHVRKSSRKWRTGGRRARTATSASVQALEKRVLLTTTTLASATPGGAAGNLWSSNAAISVSGDGRFVAFESYASDLVAGDTNYAQDIFVYDRTTGTVERVSLSSAGVQGNFSSFRPSISADGQFVAFESYATNLVAGDSNFMRDVFVYDRTANTIQRASVGAGGAQANWWSGNARISADGKTVAFESVATNLVAGDTNFVQDIFVRDLTTNTTERVSLSNTGGQSHWHSFNPSISADGHFVAFDSYASNLVTGDTNFSNDIFVRDRTGATTERVSISTAGVQGNYHSWRPSLSADGTIVAFASSAMNLVAGDTNLVQDIFVYDRTANTIERVSTSAGGTQANWHSFNPSISGDGQFVAFDTYASNLVTGDTNRTVDVFLVDRLANTITRASVTSNDAQANGHSSHASVSSDGRFVAFQSSATNLSPSDTRYFNDIYVRDTSSAPSNITLSNSTIAENQPAGTSVGALAATDADPGDTFTFTLVSGTGDTDNASFTIMGSQLQTTASFDFETKPSYSIRVRATDSFGLTFDRVFTITVTNVSDSAPTNIALSNATIAENQPIATAIGNLTATDVDTADTFTFQLVNGAGDTDNLSFSIFGNELRSAAVFDFETKASYSIRIQVTDSTNRTFQKEFTVMVSDVANA
ncbi:MAG: cadherin domain-containing protein [Planctomycetaceae bacterium]|nr:cadherin domain-containing protein [Planctomycetaceae bacterium]